MCRTSPSSRSVCIFSFFVHLFCLLNTSDVGEKVCRVCAKGTQRGHTQGRRGEDQKGLRGAWGRRHPRLSTLYAPFPTPSHLSSISLWEQCSYLDFYRTTPLPTTIINAHTHIAVPQTLTWPASIDLRTYTKYVERNKRNSMSKKLSGKESVRLNFGMKQ